jgi:uncharacterized protein (TIGR02996 family)
MPNPTLEQAIFDDPDDREAWQVYADWLQQQDDPRGEIISLDLAAAQVEGPAKAELEARKAALEAEHRERLLGPLAELLADHDLDEAVALEWSRGYIVKATIGCSDEDWEGPPIADLVAALVRSPAALFLAELWVGTSYDQDEDWIGLFERNLAAVTDAGPLAALTRLTVADTDNYWDISSTRIGDITALLRAAPRLRELKVVGGEIELAPTVHERLTKLELETGGLPGTTAAALAQSSFPALTHLTVYFGADRYGASATRADVEALLTNANLSKLEHLGLVDAEFQDEIAAALAASPMLERLRSVDLSLGTMTDEGVAAIVAAASRFAKLERLDVGDNFLSAEGIARLRAALPLVELEVSGQKDPRGRNGQLRYYVSVGE